MKKINEGELFGHLNSFLKDKGIELKPGPYSQRIEKGCSLLSSALNAGQKGLKRAQEEAVKTIEEMRQVIHESTAPKPPPAAKTKAKPQAKAKAQAKAKPSAKGPAPKTAPGRTARKAR